MALVFAGALASAWVAVGDERIAYAGFQAAFAFFLCILQGSAPAFDMATARDRVIGILIGIFVSYLMFVLVWPVSLARRIDPGLREAIANLRAMVSAAGAQARRILAAQSLAAFGALERELDLIAYEANGIRPPADWLESRRAMAPGEAPKPDRSAAPQRRLPPQNSPRALRPVWRLLEKAIGQGGDLEGDLCSRPCVGLAARWPRGSCPPASR